MKIFLCHASEDKKTVCKIKKDLDSRGFETLIDEDFIPYGGLNLEYIEKASEQSEIMMCFLSKSFLNSEWVKPEWKHALIRQIEGERITVIPVLIEEIEPPGFLAGRRYLDLSNEDTYCSNLSNFVKSIRENKAEENEEEKENDNNEKDDQAGCLIIVLMLLILFFLFLVYNKDTPYRKKQDQNRYYNPNVIDCCQ